MKGSTSYITFTFSHLADAFIQSDLQLQCVTPLNIIFNSQIRPKSYVTLYGIVLPNGSVIFLDFHIILELKENKLHYTN